MAILIITLFLMVLFARKEQSRIDYEIESGNSVTFGHGYWAVIILLIFVFGLRTSYNDTGTYMRRYVSLNVDYAWSHLVHYLEEAKYSGYSLFNLLLKKFVSSDPQVFVLAYSIIFIWGFTWIFRKTSSYFSWTMYLFVTTGVFMFGLAAIKQITAMTLWYMGYVFHNEKKRGKALVCFIIAPTFHIYAIGLFILFFLGDRVWSKQTIIIIILSIFFTLSLDRFVSVADTITGMLGIEYNMDEAIFSRAGMNVFRILVFSVTPFLSFLMKEKVNQSGDIYVIIGCNTSIVAFAILLIAGVAGGNAIGRVAYYYLPLSFVAQPWLINNISADVTRKNISILAKVLYFIFFLVQYSDYARFVYSSLPFRWIGIN